MLLRLRVMCSEIAGNEYYTSIQLLEYCVQAWRPHNQNDIDNLEGEENDQDDQWNGRR